MIWYDNVFTIIKMIVIKDVSRTNSLWDLGSWAVKCIFLRQLWDCQEDAVTMTVTINNLLKECDWVLYTVLSWRFLKPRTFIPAVWARGRKKKDGPGEAEAGDKNTLDTHAIWDSIIKWLWIISCTPAWIFHKECIWKVHQNKLFDSDNYYNNHSLLSPHLFENE